MLSCIFSTAICSPRGYGSSSNHFSAFKEPIPVPNHIRVIPGLPDLLPPMSVSKRATKRNQNRNRKQKNKSDCPAPPLASYSSISSGLGLTLASATTLPASPPSWATGVSRPGKGCGGNTWTSHHYVLFGAEASQRALWKRQYTTSNRLHILRRTTHRAVRRNPRRAKLLSCSSSPVH